MVGKTAQIIGAAALAQQKQFIKDQQDPLSHARIQDTVNIQKELNKQLNQQRAIEQGNMMTATSAALQQQHIQNLRNKMLTRLKNPDREQLLMGNWGEPIEPPEVKEEVQEVIPGFRRVRTA